MKRPFFFGLLFFFIFCLIGRISAAEDSLFYCIGRTDQMDLDLKTFEVSRDSFFIELIGSVGGTFAGSNDFTAACQVGWNDEDLVLKIDITDNELIVGEHDNQLWAHDCVEIFLAPSVGGGSYYQLVMSVEEDGTLRSKFYDFRKDTRVPLRHSSSARKTDSGWRVGVRLPWTNLGIRPSVGSEIGMQFFANDSDSGRDNRQLQWYPRAVSHSSDWMHRLQLQESTTDKHLVYCTTKFTDDSIRLDLVTGGRCTFAEFDILDRGGQKAAAAVLHPLRNGLKGASVLLPAGVSYPYSVRFVHEDQPFGSAVVLNPSALTSGRIEALKNMMIVPKKKWGYLFEAGVRPEVAWSDPQQMAAISGSDEIHVRWYDGSCREVTSFDTPGRYLAYAEAPLPDGRVLRRSATFYALPPDSHPWRDDTRVVIYHRSRPWWHPWRGNPHARVDFIEGLGFGRASWQAHEPLLSAWAGKAFFEFMESDPYGPVVFSYLAEAGRYSDWPTNAQTPEIADMEIHLDLKRRVLGLPESRGRLRKPQLEQPGGRELRAGSAEEAGFEPDAPEPIRALCRRGYEESGEPFAVLIAKDGVVFFHEAFGQNAYGETVTTETPMFMASVTKCMTGLMFGQFVEQGLIGIDDPVGRFLPDFPKEGEKAITFRHCFTHTTGLTGHYEFGGMHNAWLENAIAMGLEALPVGTVHEYNGMGYDLAGKAMEIAAGKSAFRILHEHLYEPLGMTHTVLDDMATCSTSTPMDLARLGQMILNGGCYGSKRFFSEATLAQLLPCDLKPYFPEIEKNWGIGMTWMPTEDPESEKSGRCYLLSDRVVGHGAASSAIFRIDLENQVIVVQTRNQAGPAYDRYYVEFMKLIDRTMKRQSAEKPL